MSEQKRYTADEIRKMADWPSYCGDDCEVHLQPELVPMLCQAADDAEENAQLKARLEAVVKECEKWKWADDNWCTSVKDATDTHNRCIDRILHIARGDGGAE